jgi:hydrogenase maturation protein HypF
MASRHGIFGEVDNRTDGVSVIVQCEKKTLDRFRNDILMNAPPASRIKSIEVNPVEHSGFAAFNIVSSKYSDDDITEISPDIAVCSECLADMENDPGRLSYPFINCTNCGPRFSIIDALPYDRPSTTMRDFIMCSRCSKEYNEILDRRFHAQPIACNSCGPAFHYGSDEIQSGDLGKILEIIAAKIASGASVAVKGLGGYNLICDALNNDAVLRLRERKHRDSKPFAVMFRDIMAVKEYCYVSEAEEKELRSWRRPVIIFRQRKFIPESVNAGLQTVGAILPYVPFHYLLFRHIETPALVFTSGNISDEPIIADDANAETHLYPVADAILTYNRQILNRVDDSVVRIADNKLTIIRRSRGFVPRPVDVKFDVGGIIALGAEEKNTFCIGKGRQALMSQHIGDLKNPAAYGFFRDTIERFNKLFRFRPAMVACDLHPDYLTTLYAEKLETELNIPLIRVQHHHAHIASCMAEHGIDEDVIGVSLDGTGYGTDGNIWGGEFLVCNLRNFRRESHFDYIPMPGGEKAVAEPWRMAFSYLYKYFGKNFDFESLPVFRNAGNNLLAMIMSMTDANINTPLSSGAGRLFDAVAALTGLCSYASFDAEAPMRLESAVADGVNDYYPFTVNGTVMFGETLKAIISDLRKEKTGIISARFHNTVAQVVLTVTKRMSDKYSLNRVVLSGGVFQNKYLLEKTSYLLRSEGFRVFSQHLVSPNDGGISLGQLAVAANTKNIA